MWGLTIVVGAFALALVVMSFTFMGGAVIVAVPLAIIAVGDCGVRWTSTGGVRRPRASTRTARTRRRSWSSPTGTAARWSPSKGSHAAGADRLLGLAVRQLARRGSIRRGSARAAGSRATPRSSTRSRSTRPSTGSPRATRSRAGSSRRRPGFVFAAKASRYMTHIKRLQNLAEGIGRFYEGIEPLVESGKLGPGRLAVPRELQARRRSRSAARSPLLPPGRHCFEFRHESWFTEPVYRLLRAHGAALVIADHPRWPFQAHELTTDWTLVRLHHGHRGRRGNYSGTELDELGPADRRVAPPGRGVRLLQQRLGGLRRRQRPLAQAAAAAVSSAVERPPQQPRDVHLRVADPLADLALRQVVHEAQLEHLALDLGERVPCARDRVAVLDQLVGRVIAPRAGPRATRTRRRRERRARRVRRPRSSPTASCASSTCSTEQPRCVSHLTHLGRAPELLGEDLGRAAHRERALLEVARHVERPALVAEVALELAEDGGRGVARELRPAARARSGRSP